MYTIHIEPEATGRMIREISRAKGIRARDLADILGFTTCAAVYKWFRGESLPAIDNLVIIARVLNVRLEDLLVIS